MAKNMLSKIELEFLKCPENFNGDYRRVLRHRIKAKTHELQDELALLEVSGLSITKNCNGVTEFSNGMKNQISPNRFDFGILRWAEPDLNRRPLARKANVLTRLDDRPPQFACIQLELSCFEL